MTDTSPKSPAREPDDITVVKVSRRDLEDARRLLSLLARIDGKEFLESSPSDDSQRKSVTLQTLQRRARQILADRRKRHEVFGKAMFGEPAWEMLLLLYVLHSGPRQTIGRLAELAGASKTTALRWLDYLDAQGLVSRESHPTDKRAAFVELTEKARTALELYLSDTLPSGE